MKEYNKYYLNYCTKYMEVATIPGPLDFNGVPYPQGRWYPKVYFYLKVSALDPIFGRAGEIR